MKIIKKLSPIMESISNVGKNKKKMLDEEFDINHPIGVLPHADAVAMEQHIADRAAGLERRANPDKDPLVKELIDETASEKSRTLHYDVVDRKGLAKILTEAKKNNQKFKVGKSNKEGYRYFVDILPIYGSKGALEVDDGDTEVDGEVLTESKKEKDEDVLDNEEFDQEIRKALVSGGYFEDEDIESVHYVGDQDDGYFQIKTKDGEIHNYDYIGMGRFDHHSDDLDESLLKEDIEKELKEYIKWCEDNKKEAKDYKSLEDYLNQSKLLKEAKYKTPINDSEDYINAMYKAYKALSKRKTGYAAVYGYSKNKKFTPLLSIKDSQDELNKIVNSLKTREKGATDVTVYTLFKDKLDDVETLLKEKGLLKESLNESVQGKYSERLWNALDQGILDYETVAEAAIYYLSDDEVEDLAIANDWVDIFEDPEDDIDEDPEDDDLEETLTKDDLEKIRKKLNYGNDIVWPTEEEKKAKKDELSKFRKQLKGDDLDEDLQLYASSLKDFKPAKEAEGLWNEIIEKGKLDDLEYELENVFKADDDENASIDIEGLNDLLVNHQDFIRTLIGLDEAPLEDDDYDEKPVGENEMVYYEDNEEPVDEDAPIEDDEDDIDVDDIEGVDADDEDDIEPVYGDEEERKTLTKWKKIESDEKEIPEDEEEDKEEEEKPESKEEDKEEKKEEKVEESLDKKEPEIKLDEAAGTIKRKGFNLPSEITVSLDELDLDDIDDEDEVGEAISNYLSGEYGFTQYSFEWERGDNVEEINIDNIKWDISESLEEDLEEAAYQVMVMHQDYSETLHFLTAKSIEQLEYKISKIDPHYIDYSIVSKEQEPAENKNEEDDLEECNKDLKECGPSKDDDLTESIAKGFVKSNFTEAKDMSGMTDEEKRQELARKSLASLNESDEEVIDINDEELTEALGMPTEDQVKKEEPKKEEAKPEEVKEEPKENKNEEVK